MKEIIQYFQSNKDWLDPFISALGIVVNLLGVIIGVVFIVYQVRKQLMNTIKTQQEEFKDNLKLEIYKEIASKKQIAEAKLGDAHIKIWQVPSRLKFYWEQREALRLTPGIIRERAMVLIDSHYEALKQINELTLILENYRTVLPKFDIFRKMSSYYQRKAMGLVNEFGPYLMRYLPRDIPDPSDQTGSIVIPFLTERPSPEDMDKMSNLAQEYQNVCGEINGVLYDLGIEAQRALLVNIFPSKLSPRKPKDATTIVITMEKENLNKALRFLNENDPWVREYGAVHELEE